MPVFETDSVYSNDVHLDSLYETIFCKWCGMPITRICEMSIPIECEWCGMPIDSICDICILVEDYEEDTFDAIYKIRS
jgi:hypothetical protein